MTVTQMPLFELYEDGAVYFTLRRMHKAHVTCVL